jgi:hypothetical protein
MGKRIAPDVAHFPGGEGAALALPENGLFLGR